jgi:hypothetical protein
MNPFKTDDIVKTVSGNKVGGKVKYVACKGATVSGGKTCDKKTCGCVGRDYVWVEWIDGKVYSYEYTELEYDKQTQTTTSIEKTDEVKTNPNIVIPDLPNDFNFDMYNGITQVRYTRDGRTYVVNVGGNIQTNDAPAIEEKDLDFDAYNRKGVVRKIK